MLLSQEEKNRYSRHILLSEIGEEGQLKLKSAKVLVIGAGGLGCPVLQYLSAAGVGTIGIVDGDQVGLSNLQRQILYTTQDIGFSKAEKAMEKLKAMNPLLDYKIYTSHLSKDNVFEIFEQYDVVVDCTDNFPTRYMINDACVILKKPLVFGAIFKFDGQVTVLNYKGGPTYRCLFPEAPGAGEMPNCSEIGVIGVLPGIIGSLQANEVIKMITGIGDVLSGKFFVFDALTMQSSNFEFALNPQNLEREELEENYVAFCGLEQEVTAEEITAETLKEWQSSQKDFQLLDVREAWEREEFNIGGQHIPLSFIPHRFSEVDFSKPTVIYCQKGGRSMQALRFLKQKSIASEQLHSLSGGMDYWQDFINS
ncbi:HesA/MoeB/ThiF family protein [Sediminitomix flava]|uniref:Molybdopterin-synthase adenylyltransferase n=1 Tax=Sediminitomix flava TaxID=379075 RepID=A0A315Z7S5_SEDFL|nr:HesA/MoeB/ThiF family protein [Sediminitomix flava]PWJ41012.1 adenylyltransferase/sulfurtransferase [Sediminitomix flava]